MIDPLLEWRSTLYYLGFLSSLAFSARFLIQWFVSEKQKKSVVNKIFWQLSLFGAGAMVIHSIIQVQYSPCLIQAINGIIAWRNLNLMEDVRKRYSLSTVLLLFLLCLPLTTLPFILQGYFFFDGEIIWARSPISIFNSVNRVQPLAWDIIGFIGIALFASRFWVQWWSAEKHQKSFLGPSFWWISLVGAFISIAYFYRLGDLINTIGPAIGIAPYIRNLMLLRSSSLKKLRNEP